MHLPQFLLHLDEKYRVENIHLLLFKQQRKLTEQMLHLAQLSGDRLIDFRDDFQRFVTQSDAAQVNGDFVAAAFRPGRNDLKFLCIECDADINAALLLCF